MSVRVVRNKPSLCSVSTKIEYIRKVAMRHHRLRLRRYAPAPNFMSSMSKHLPGITAQYHIKRVEMRQTALIAGQQHDMVHYHGWSGTESHDFGFNRR